MFSPQKFKIFAVFLLLFIFFIPNLVLAGDCCYNRTEDVCHLKPGTICPERLGYEEVDCASTPGCPTPAPPSPTESLTCFCCNGADGFQDELSLCESFCSGRGGLERWSKTGEPEVTRACPAPPPGSATGETTTPSKPPSQELINPLGGTSAAPEGVTSVPALIANIIKTILGIVGAVALFMFVWGGFGWLTSGGNPDKVKAGRDTLVWATIGLLVIFASYTLVDVVFRALGAI